MHGKGECFHLTEVCPGAWGVPMAGTDGSGSCLVMVDCSSLPGQASIRAESSPELPDSGGANPLVSVSEPKLVPTYSYSFMPYLHAQEV